jgi:hypothetical protein
VLVAIIAAAVVAAVALSGGGEKQAATTSTGTATTTATTATAAVGLAGVVPNDVMKYCQSVAPTAGAALMASCSPPAGGTVFYPDSWSISLFPNSNALRQAYNSLRRQNDIGKDFGACSGIEWGGEGAWAHGPGKPGGRRFCYFSGNVAVIVWAHEKLGQPTHIDTLGVARASGSDHSNLFSWFRFWHHRIGKCSAPDCEARLQ